MLFSGVLNFISRIFLGPIFTGISAIVPSFTQFFASVLQFFSYGIQYLTFFTKLLMIPQSLMVIFFGLAVGIFTFNITIRVVGLGVGIYRHFKP